VVATDTCALCVELTLSDFEPGANDQWLCEDEKWHPCEVLSKGLNDIGEEFDVHDKEMLGII